MRWRGALAGSLLLASTAHAGPAYDGERFVARVERAAPNHTDLTPPVLCYCSGAGQPRRVGQLLSSFSAIGGGGALFVVVTCAIPRFEWLPTNRPGDLVGDPFEVTCADWRELPR